MPITSKPYADTRAIEINDSDFEKGALKVKSYVRRPGKLFTANLSLMKAEIGKLKKKKLKTITDAVVDLFR